jgi:hypothetical protein
VTIPRTPGTTSEAPAKLTVTFARIGRTHNPPPLELGGFHEQFWGGPAQQIGAYAKGFLASREVSVSIQDDGRVLIFVGGFRNGGEGRITPWPVAS